MSDYQCAFCSCIFSSEADLGIHLDAFGRVAHEWDVRRVHRGSLGVKHVLFGYCFAGVEPRDYPRLVFESMDNFVLCCDCRNFLLFERITEGGDYGNEELSI